MKRAGLLLLCYAAFAVGARAQAPCCSITAVNAATGVVSAKVNANGEAFQFRLTDANLLKEVRVGGGVYANFTTHQVSMDGKSIVGPITSGPQAPAPTPAALAPLLKTSPVIATAGPAAACCSITAINAASGQVTARVTATGQAFTFTANPSVFNSLKVGQGIFANFGAKQISIDGKSIVGSIVNLGVAPSSALSGANAGGNAGTTGGTPLSTITALNGQNLVTAQTATGTFFVFAPDPPSLSNLGAVTQWLKVGQNVYANFTTKQVSLDGGASVATIKYLCTIPPNQPCPPSAASCQEAFSTTFGCPSFPYQSSTPASCKTGYYGPNCTPSPSCPSPNGVSSGGITGTGVCTCNPGFNGPSCQYSNASTCSGHGTVNYSGTCACNAGYGGANCNKQN